MSWWRPLRRRRESVLRPVRVRIRRRNPCRRFRFLFDLLVRFFFIGAVIIEVSLPGNQGESSPGLPGDDSELPALPA